MRRIASKEPKGWKFHAQAKMLVREIDHDLFFHVARVEYVKRHECLEAFAGFQTYYDPRLDGVFVRTRNVFREFLSIDSVKENSDRLSDQILTTLDSFLAHTVSSQDFETILSEPLLEEKCYRLVLRSLISLNDEEYDKAKFLLSKAIELSKIKPFHGYLLRGVWIEVLANLCMLDTKLANETLKKSLHSIREAIFHDRTSDKVNFRPWSV